MAVFVAKVKSFGKGIVDGIRRAMRVHSPSLMLMNGDPVRHKNKS